MYRGSQYVVVEERDEIKVERGIVHWESLSINADSPELYRKLASALNEAADVQERKSETVGA